MAEEVQRNADDPRPTEVGGARPDRNRVKTLLGEALDRPAPERMAFLEQATGSDSELRREVIALLDALGKHEDLMAAPTGGSVLIASEDLTEISGTIVGRYKLLQEIGSGGFGVVWMAEQQEPVVRKVALKVIKLGMDTRQVIARFESERQALALMDHPNIAKVLDGGATNSGRPYFVMELVKGVPITDYCDKARLGTKERLKLFMQVCYALQHAHQKGIIHRDIKPSNVLVTLHDGNPIPKVIDFGIAKATTRRLTEKTLFTQFQQMIGTPEYMSPEQAEMSGLDIDTRADIYSLGVLLYELLTGALPFDSSMLRERGYMEMLRVIREQQPQKPSTKISTLGDVLTEVANNRHTQPGQLRRVVRGDLDWIVMKALEKDRRRRYETARDFSEDVRRHLEHEPVEAGPPSTVYRMQKFVRRYRAVVLATSLVVISLGVGLVTTWSMYLETARQARIADRRFDSLHEFSRVFLYGFESAIHDLPGSKNARLLLAEKATEYLDRLAAEAGNDPEILSDVARGCQKTAEIYWGGGLQSLEKTEQARKLIDRAKAIHDRLWRGWPAMRPRLFARPSCLYFSARLYLEAGDAVACARECEQATRLLVRAAELRWPMDFANDCLVWVEITHGEALHRFPGKEEEVKRHLASAGELLLRFPEWSEVGGQAPPGATSKVLPAAAALAVAHANVGQASMAVPLFRQLIPLLNRFEALAKSDRRVASGLVNILSAHANILITDGRHADARVPLKKMIALSRVRVSLDESDVSGWVLLAHAHRRLATVEKARGDEAEQRRQLAEIINIGNKPGVASGVASSHDFLRQLIGAHTELAESAGRRGELAPQRRHAQEAVDAGRRLVAAWPREAPELGWGLCALAKVELAAGRKQQAEALLREALDIAANVLDTEPRSIRALSMAFDATQLLVSGCSTQGLTADVQLVKEHIARLEAWPRDKNGCLIRRQTANAHALLANVLSVGGDFQRAALECHRVIEVVLAIPDLDLYGRHLALRRVVYEAQYAESRCLQRCGEFENALEVEKARARFLEGGVKGGQADMMTARHLIDAYDQQREMYRRQGRIADLREVVDQALDKLAIADGPEPDAIGSFVVARLLNYKCQDGEEHGSETSLLQPARRAVELLEPSYDQHSDDWLWRLCMGDALLHRGIAELKLGAAAGRRAFAARAKFIDQEVQRSNLHAYDLRDHAQHYFLCPVPELRNDDKGASCLARMISAKQPPQTVLMCLEQTATRAVSQDRPEIGLKVARAAVRYLEGLPGDSHKVEQAKWRQRCREYQATVGK